MAVVQVPPSRGGGGGGGVGVVRRLIGIAVLAAAAGAAGFIWWSRLAPDRSGDVVAYVQQMVDGGGGGSSGDPGEADARQKVGAVANNAGAGVNIRVRKGDVAGGDGSASHNATVSNDVGDEIILRIACDGPNKCRVIAVEGHVQADPNADLKKREPGAKVAPPGIRNR